MTNKTEVHRFDPSSSRIDMILQKIYNPLILIVLICPYFGQNVLSRAYIGSYMRHE